MVSTVTTAMQMQNLNAWADVARAEIMEKYQPGEPDGKVDNAFLQIEEVKIQPLGGGRKTADYPYRAKVRTGEKSGKPEGQEAVTRWTDFPGYVRIRVWKTVSG